jgi:hypothetical protein
MKRKDGVDGKERKVAKKMLLVLKFEALNISLNYVCVFFSSFFYLFRDRC